MTRWIAFEKINNARELGGISVSETHEIKRAMLYRTARLSSMTDMDIAMLDHLNVGLIIDYRHHDEAALNPTPSLGHIKIKNIPAMNTNTGVSEADFQKMIETLDFTTFINAMVETYKQMPFGNPAYIAMFDFIKQLPDQALLHHCTVGRDRTGVGSALILLLLGVERDSIIEDYLLSNEGLYSVQKGIIESEAPGLSTEQYDSLLEAMRVQEHYIQATFDAIDSKYDSLDDYFINEFGIDHNMTQAIREHYLVEKN